MTGAPRLVASDLKQCLLFFTVANLCHHLYVLQSFGIIRCYLRPYLALCFCTCCSLCLNALSAYFFLTNSYSSLKAQLEIRCCLFCETSSLQAFAPVSLLFFLLPCHSLPSAIGLSCHRWTFHKPRPRDSFISVVPVPNARTQTRANSLCWLAK